MQRQRQHRASHLLFVGVLATAPLLTGADGCDLTVIGQVQPAQPDGNSPQDAGAADADIDAPLDPNDPGAGPCGGACGPGEHCLESCNPPGVGICVAPARDCASVLPVCGCDGVTYATACDAITAGVPLAFHGPCSGEAVEAGAGTTDAGVSDAGVSDAGGDDPRCAADYDAGVYELSQNGYPVSPDAGTNTCDPATCGTLPQQPCANPDVSWAADCVPDDATGACAWHVECGNPAPVTCQSNADCQPTEFCDVDCNQGSTVLGTCMSRPTTCLLGSRKACGCDGETYDNECNAHANGVSVAHPGCCTP